MSKYEILKRIEEKKIVAVIRANDLDDARKIVDACLKGGIDVIELTFTIPYADEIIRSLSKEIGDKVLIGAGTIMDSETAKIAIQAGAKFIVSPFLDNEVVKTCLTYQVPCMPGAMTVKEVVEAMRAGADIIKVFPGGIVGPAFIKNVHGPIPQVKMMPTGGVEIDNVEDWLNNGAVAIGVGSKLTFPSKDGQYEKITELSRNFIDEINKWKDGQNG